MNRIANSESEDAYETNVTALQSNEAWATESRLRKWFTSKWLANKAVSKYNVNSLTGEDRADMYGKRTQTQEDFQDWVLLVYYCDLKKILNSILG